MDSQSGMILDRACGLGAHSEFDLVIKFDGRRTRVMMTLIHQHTSWLQDGLLDTGNDPSESIRAATVRVIERWWELIGETGF